MTVIHQNNRNGGFFPKLKNPLRFSSQALLANGATLEQSLNLFVKHLGSPTFSRVLMSISASFKNYGAYQFGCVKKVEEHHHVSRNRPFLVTQGRGFAHHLGEIYETH